ncbi:MAG: hypothetical protein JXB45_06040 [Candidatus Krumholzibacteriota bacterium]|nr:hypothetical protein [Candidatus Krumholzibacteriota bacterium]
MKMFINTVIFGATLGAGIISVFQNAPFLVFMKRVSVTFFIFYAVGMMFNILWRTSSVYIPQVRSGDKEKREQAER